MFDGDTKVGVAPNAVASDEFDLRHWILGEGVKGLAVNGEARVLRADGTLLPNLFAVGGAAQGVSGSKASGYLSGNGLLTAFAYGYLAGDAAARL